MLAVFYPRTGLGAQPSVNASAACSFVGADRQCTLGLSPGFWRRYTKLWASTFPTSQRFDDVFAFDTSVEIFGEATLENVITFAVDPVDSFLDKVDENMVSGNANSVGAQIRSLGFQAVAALQNAATAVPYALSVSAVKSDVASALQQAYDGNISTVKSLKDELDGFNNQSSVDEEERLKQLLGG